MSQRPVFRQSIFTLEQLNGTLVKKKFLFVQFNSIEQGKILTGAVQLQRFLVFSHSTLHI